MEKSKQSTSSLPLVIENLKAIKVLVGDALQDCCYCNEAREHASYNFGRFSAALEAVRTLNADAINLLKSRISDKVYSYELKTQIDMLTNERNALIKSKIPGDEYNFIKEYDSIIAELITK